MDTLTLARSSIKPIHHMMDIMESIRRGNDLSLRVNATGWDKVAAMGNDLNKLLHDFRGVSEIILSSTAQESASAVVLSSITDEANGRIHPQIHDTEMVAAATNSLANEVTHASEVIVMLEQESLNIGAVLDVTRGHRRTDQPAGTERRH
jgi:methyl-accepting chemotaxis protein